MEAVAAFPNMTPQRFAGDVQPLARPAVMPGLAASWPLVKLGRQGVIPLCRHLDGRANATPVEVWRGRGADYGYSDDLTGFDFVRERMRFAELLDLLVAAQEKPAAIYAGAIPVPQVLPRLMAEVPMPLLADGAARLTSLWIGTASRTAAHWDLAQNIAVCVAGTRTYTLFPPEQVENLYVGPLDHTLAGQPVSLVDVTKPDLARFPRFADALAVAQRVTLRPGDALYLPSLWWHHVETPAPFGAQVNFWWRDAPADAMTPLLTLFHGLLTLRDLPVAERRAWRAFFDHYLFEAEVPEHIPEGARGVLGAMTGERRRELARVIAQSLVRDA
ncbi:cupin-like domain-containing protein [Sandaracinobacteroides saxicola]|uniref:Cupin-like domain-containing protein n=1 Tax=Sandaracinobacteroides saxicola TaxID=2759707 RepID=A0A7G5IEQ7_9SPHN|nr:cupin-like domain-containing protein [Sandaracinobacteroides saxicola]QMW21849.1 cupin-like domain-containing protein [Sandaracinobacteroides saxicola]